MKKKTPPSEESSNNQKKEELTESNSPTLEQCHICGAVLPEGSDICIICGTQKGRRTPAGTVSKAVEPEKHASSSRSFRRNRTVMGKISAVLSIVLIVLAVGVGVFEYVSYLNLLSRFTLENAILYQQSGNVLKLSLDNVEEPYDLTNRFQSSSSALSAKPSDDFRFLGYLNNQRNFGKGVSGDLYLLDLLNLDEDSTGPHDGIQVTDSQVSDFHFLKDEDSLLYLTTSGELYLTEYRPLTSFLGTRNLQSTLLDNEVKGIGQVADGTVLYYKGDHVDSTTFVTNQTSHTGSSFDLYTLSLDGRRERPTLIAKNVYSVLDCSKGFSRVFYTKRTHNPPLVQYELYRYDSNVDEETLITNNVWHVVDANATRNRVVYLSPIQDMIRYDDLFDDDMAEADGRELSSTLRSPEEATETIIEEEPSEITQEDSQSDENEIPVDTSQEIEGEELEQPDQEITPTEERLLRDKFRAHLKSSIRDTKQENYLSFDLYVYTGANDLIQQMAGPIYHWDTPENLAHLDKASDVVVYVESDPSQMIKQKISELTTSDLELYLETPFDLLPFMAEHMPDSLYLLTLSSGETRKLFSEPGSRYISDFYIPPTHNSVYFISYPTFDSRTGTLYLVPFESTDLGDTALYQDDDVESIIGLRGGEQSGLIYQTASLDDPPQRNLYSVSVSGISEVAIDTSSAEHVQLLGEEEQFVSFFRNYNAISKTGDWYLAVNDEEVQIAEDITSVTSESSDALYAVRRESNSFRSLYEYREGEFTLLDERLGGYLVFTHPQE